MKVPTSLMIIIFQLFKCATAANWNPNNPLILVQREGSRPIFPKVVRLINEYPVYTNAGEENSVITYAYCPEPNSAYPYCNYSQGLGDDQMRGILPIRRCVFPVDFEMIKQINSENIHQSCSHNGKDGYIYEFVYWLCRHGTEVRTPVMIYEVCYDNNQMETIVAKLKIFTPNLLANLLLSTEQSFPFQFDDFHYHDANTKNISNIAHELYDRAKQVRVGGNFYIPRPILPPEWVAFAHRRKPLFSHMNCAPMDVRLIRTWETLMMNLKSKLTDLLGPLYVTAGLHGEIQDGQTGKRYLGIFDGNSKIPISKVFWVLIYGPGFAKGIVIAMHNELLDPHEDPLDAGCSITVCRYANLGNILPNRDRSSINPYIYCCYPLAIAGLFDLRGQERNEILRFPRG